MRKDKVFILMAIMLIIIIPLPLFFIHVETMPKIKYVGIGKSINCYLKELYIAGIISNDTLVVMRRVDYKKYIPIYVNREQLPFYIDERCAIIDYNSYYAVFMIYTPVITDINLLPIWYVLGIIILSSMLLVSLTTRIRDSEGLVFDILALLSATFTSLYAFLIMPQEPAILSTILAFGLMGAILCTTWGDDKK